MNNRTTNTSILHDRDAVKHAAETSASIKDALAVLNLRAAGGNYKQFKLACERFDIAPPVHKKEGNKNFGKESGYQRTVSNEEAFVENSTYNNRTMLKKRLFELGVPNLCDECGQGPVWNNKPLTLTLDHINGIWNDNRIENLRILCGHCHSQTETFGSKNFKR